MNGMKKLEIQRWGREVERERERERKREKNKGWKAAEWHTRKIRFGRALRRRALSCCVLAQLC